MAARFELYVGIDVAKDSSVGHGLDSRGESVFSTVFPMNSEGFSRLFNEIKDKCGDLSKVLVAMESTACYHINLFSFFTSKGANVVVLNPLLVSNFAKLSLRKTKTDKKDALTIARFIMSHKDSVSQLSVSQDLQDLRDIARERESLCHQISAAKVEVRRLLQTLSPELEAACNPFTKVMLHFIERFPSARLVSIAKPALVKKTLQEKPCSCRIRFTPEELIEMAKRSIATVSPAKEMILRGKISILKHLEQQRDELTKALTQYCKSMMVEDS